MFWLQWPGEQSRPCPLWGPHCSNLVSFLSLCPCTPSLSVICMTKSSRPSKDCPGRVRTPVGFSSPSVGSRNPAPSSCESPLRLRVPPPQVQRLPPLLPGPAVLNQLLQTLPCLAVPFSRQQALSSVALVVRLPYCLLWPGPHQLPRVLHSFTGITVCLSPQTCSLSPLVTELTKKLSEVEHVIFVAASAMW